MQHAAGALGVPVDAPATAAGVPSSRSVEPFSTEPREIPAAHTVRREVAAKIAVYSGTGEVFNVAFDTVGASFDLWTIEAGLEAIIGSCQAALVRARIAREATA